MQLHELSAKITQKEAKLLHNKSKVKQEGKDVKDSKEIMLENSLAYILIEAFNLDQTMLIS